MIQKPNFDSFQNWLELLEYSFMSSDTDQIISDDKTGTNEIDNEPKLIFFFVLELPR